MHRTDRCPSRSTGFHLFTSDPVARARVFLSRPLRSSSPPPSTLPCRASSSTVHSDSNGERVLRYYFSCSLYPLSPRVPICVPIVAVVDLPPHPFLSLLHPRATVHPFALSLSLSPPPASRPTVFLRSRQPSYLFSLRRNVIGISPPLFTGQSLSSPYDQPPPFFFSSSSLSSQLDDNYFFIIFIRSSNRNTSCEFDPPVENLFSRKFAENPTSLEKSLSGDATNFPRSRPRPSTYPESSHDSPRLSGPDPPKGCSASPLPRGREEEGCLGGERPLNRAMGSDTARASNGARRKGLSRNCMRPSGRVYAKLARVSRVHGGAYTRSGRSRVAEVW